MCTETTTNHNQAPAIITQDQFEAQYKPVKNHVTQREEWNGWYFETYGADEAYIINLYKTEPNRIWTILDADGTMPIVSGLHHVNRFGYIVTQLPFDGNNEIEVQDDFANDDDSHTDDKTTEELQQTANDNTIEFTSGLQTITMTISAIKQMYNDCTFLTEVGMSLMNPEAARKADLPFSPEQYRQYFIEYLIELKEYDKDFIKSIIQANK